RTLPPPATPPSPVVPYTTLFRSVRTVGDHRLQCAQLRHPGHHPAEVHRRISRSDTADLVLLPAVLGVGARLARSAAGTAGAAAADRKSTRLNSSHVSISYAVCCS